MGFQTPQATAMAVENVGVKKGNFPWYIILLQGFFAGAYIAFGGMLAVMVGGGYTGSSPGIKKFLYGAVFPVGLIAVILTGSELFTGNTMALVTPLASRKINWKQFAKNWGVSYIGNFIGSVFVAYFLCYLPNIYSNSTWQGAIKAVAEGKNSLGFGSVLLRGIGCNWLVCLAVWQAVAATDMAGKILCIWWPIMAFVAVGFEHCVANMFFVPCGLMYGANSDFGTFIWANLIPATIGNIIGGSGFMGLTYWAIFSDKEPWATQRRESALKGKEIPLQDVATEKAEKDEKEEEAITV